jgi:hypothetical protein
VSASFGAIVQKRQEYSVRKSWINIIMQHVLLNYHDVHEKESKNEMAWDK